MVHYCGLSYISRYTTTGLAAGRRHVTRPVIGQAEPLSQFSCTLSKYANGTLQNVVQNILDEPIPEAVKKRLLKPLLPRPIPPPRKRKLGKQNAVLQEFDERHSVTRRRLGVKNKRDLLYIDVTQNLTDPPQFVLLKKSRHVERVHCYGAFRPPH